MARFSHHSRNHSFPPSIRYVQKPSKTLAQPLPDIDDEPWAHFLATGEVDDDDDEQYTDYLHFDAGILAGSEAQKRKTNKFKSYSGKTEQAVKHHHGAFSRRSFEHGFVQGQYTNTNQADRHNFSSPRMLGDPVHGRRTRRRGNRTLSGHRHSWQEPSLTTVAEEIPRIVVSDYDDDNISIDFSTSSESSASTDSSEDLSLADLNLATAEDVSETTPQTTNETAPDMAPEPVFETPKAPESPRMKAWTTPAAEKPDAQLNRMWLAERARL